MVEKLCTPYAMQHISSSLCWALSTVWDMFHIYYKNHDSSDGTVTRLQAGLPRNRASITGRGERIFRLQDFQTGSGTLLTSGKMDKAKPSLTDKRPLCEADRSPLSSAKIKNEGISASAPHIYLHGAHTDNLTCTYSCCWVGYSLVFTVLTF